MVANLLGGQGASRYRSELSASRGARRSRKRRGGHSKGSGRLIRACLARCHDVRIDRFALLQRMKSRDEWRYIPVIMLSARTRTM
jgi:hypothetical protein